MIHNFINDLRIDDALRRVGTTLERDGTGNLNRVNTHDPRVATASVCPSCLVPKDEIPVCNYDSDMAS